MTDRVAMVTGGRGRLAQAVTPVLERAGWTVVSLGHDDLDITRRSDVTTMVRSTRPDAVVNLAAWTDIDACEADPERAMLVNGLAVASLAEACEEVGAHLCHVSSDYVFDGLRSTPYRETDEPHPLSAYGRSKLAGEGHAGPNATVVRVGWLNGRHGRCFVRTLIEQASDPDRVLPYVTDQIGSPTSTDDVAVVVSELVAERRPGLFHVASGGQASRFEFARHVLDVAGLGPDRVVPVTTADLVPTDAAARPAYSVLENAALRALGRDVMPHWSDAVALLARRAELAGADALTTRR